MVHVMDMVRKLNSEINLITLDNDKIRTMCKKLLYDNRGRDRAMCDLTGLVKRSLDPPSGRLPQPDAFRPHPIIRQDLMDNDGNLRATDIGITWAGTDAFLHGVKVVGPRPATSTPYQPTGPRPEMSTPSQSAMSTPHQPTGPRPATSTPYQPATSTPYQPATSTPHQPTGPRPATSTPCQPVKDHGGCNKSTSGQPPTLPTCLEIPDTCTPLRRAPQENRQGYRPAAPIQRFNNKSLNWPSWFRNFRTVADVHVWDDNQRALQLVSYLDETAMNVVQELGDDELYDDDILVKLLGDRFDAASRVSASRYRFHGRLRRHHEDADSFADAITDLCHVGYPQSSPELRQNF